MLVLDRRTGEDIVIGTGTDRITVTLIDSSHHHARLGIDAPAHIAVHRKEVADRIESGEPRRRPMERRPHRREVSLMPGTGGL